MKAIHRKSPILSIILMAFALLVIVFNAVTMTASADSHAPVNGEHLITVHDNGKQRGILTRAATLREALQQYNIRIDENDRVEPGLDEPLTASSYDVNIYRARPITIVDGAVQAKVLSPYRTPSQIAKSAGITIHDEDETILEGPSDIARFGTGVRLVVNRATPFTLILYGKKTTAYSQKETVGEMLADKGIHVGEKDTLSVKTTAALKKGMTVSIWRNGKQTVTVDEKIPFPVEKIEDADKPVGFREVKTAGVNGKKMVTYEIIMRNGKEVARKEIQSVVAKKAEAQVEIVGTKMENSFNGSFAEALARLRSCEGSYTSNTGNGYYGAYQFDIGTWGGYKGYANASLAPPAVQDEKAWETYQRRGWSPWPSCSASQGLQDIYR